MKSSFINKFTIQLALITFFIALSACRPVVTPKPKEQSPTMPAITLTYTPTETNTPTVTLTPTITNTRTETAIPRPEYRETLGKHLNDATLKKKEDFAGIAQDILNYPEIPGPVTLGFDPIASYETAGDSGVILICKMGTNCKVRAFVRVADPVNGPDRWYVFWEIRNPGDDHSKVLITYIGSDDTGAGLLMETQHKLDMLNKYTVDGGKTYLVIPTKLKRNIHYHNPVLKEMYPDMSAADDILKMHTIPDGLSRIPQFLAKIFT